MKFGSVKAFTVLCRSRREENEPVLGMAPFNTQLSEYTHAEHTVPVRPLVLSLALPEGYVNFGQLVSARVRFSIEQDDG